MKGGNSMNTAISVQKTDSVSTAVAGEKCPAFRLCKSCNRKNNFSDCSVYINFRNKTLKLVEKAQAGDENALEKLVKDFYRYVFCFTRKFFIPGGTVDDVVQEGLIGLLFAIKTYDGRHDVNFERYANLCIRNSITRAVRWATQKKRKTAGKLYYMDDTPAELLLISSDRFVEDTVMDRLMIEQIGRCIDDFLSRNESRILKLKLANYSVDEIASMISESRKKVENALYRARKKLRLMLSEDRPACAMVSAG